LGIREDNQTLDTGGRARYLKQDYFIFKTKQEMTRQDMNQSINRDILNQFETFTIIFVSCAAASEWSLPFTKIAVSSAYILTL